ncbi:MAG TPA: helix-turn-helix domain-containing protein [bacterium]|nr:helix-turn-helix domain-containing protein [bacterium]
MKRPQDTFQFPSELGRRLRDLRLRAGLTQPELAQVMGRTGAGRACIVSRMEKGKVRYPSLGLVADFLRGCRAGFKDVLDILDLYTNLPTTQQQVFGKALAKVAAGVPQKWQAQVTNYDMRVDLPKSSRAETRLQAKPDLPRRLERARKNAAAARRRFLYGQFLSRAVNDTGLQPVMAIAVPLFNHGLEQFRILYRTRGAKPEARERLLAESRTLFEKSSQFPSEAIRKLEDDVRRHFAELEMKGEMDWLPDLSLDAYEASLLKPGRKPNLREDQRREFARRVDEYAAARGAAVEQVWQEVQPLLDEAGVPNERRPVYRGLVGVCCSAALNHEPGSVGERRQLDEYMLEPRWVRLGLDTALAQKLANIVLACFRELAKSFPPDPRPRR